METAKDVRAEYDSLWEIVKLILEREKEIYGPTLIQGRDGGTEALKKQMSTNKTIQLSTQQDVAREFAKLYSANKKKSTGKQKIAPQKVDQEPDGNNNKTNHKVPRPKPKLDKIAIDKKTNGIEKTNGLDVVKTDPLADLITKAEDKLAQVRQKKGDHVPTIRLENGGPSLFEGTIQAAVASSMETRS